MALMSLSACPPRDFGIEYVAPIERAIGGNRSTGKLLDRLPGINVEKQILLGGIMGCGPWDFCVDVKRMRRPAPGVVVTRGSNSGNNVIRLEKLRTSIICGQQGEKRQREQKRVQFPRQVVTRVAGGLSIADIAMQHSSGNRWQWHRRKSNGSATVRTEVGVPKRPM